VGLRDPPLQEFKPKTKCNGNGNGNGEERSFGRALRQEDQKRAKENSPSVLALFVGQVRAASVVGDLAEARGERGAR
jgi:hypothetical protein